MMRRVPLAVAAIAVLAVFAWNWLVPAEPARAAPAALAAAAPAPQPPLAAAAPRDTPAPPWLRPREAAASAPGPGRSATSANDARHARLARALQHLRTLQAAQDRDPRHVSDALMELESANGSPVLQGLRLDVMRHNLAVMAQIHDLGEQMRTLADAMPRDKAPSPETAAALKDRLAQLDALKRQLRTDVLADPDPAPEGARP